MGLREDVLALADELEGVSLKDDCESCLASGTSLCRGDLECAESAHKACAKRLREIVEHDAGEVTTVSAYDLLPEDEREAIAWVREMGGIERCEAFVHQGAMEHGYLLKIAHALGTSIYDGSDNADALLEKLSERLMPEGMEWPKVDGKPVDFVTAYGPSLGVLEAVSIYSNGACDVMSHDGIIKSAKDIHIVKPKVLDADGVEIRVGDRLYDTDTGCARIVRAINANGTVEFEGHMDRGWFTWFLTHRAPVLAADGEPLRVGETVYKLDDDRPYTLKRFDGEHVYINAGGSSFDIWTFPNKLTHERPEVDSWERLEEDAEEDPCSYFGFDGEEPCGKCPASGKGCEQTMARDIVRRAKKLAGVDND